MSAYASGRFQIVPIKGDIAARAARTPDAHRPALSRRIQIPEYAPGRCHRFTPRKSRDGSRRRRQTFVGPQNATAEKRKEPDLRPALLVGLVVRLRAEMGSADSNR